MNIGGFIMAKDYKSEVKPIPEAEGYSFSEYSFPFGEGGVEACKARVANGLKCYCLEVCKCRNCGRLASCSSHPGDTDECTSKCKT